MAALTGNVPALKKAMELLLFKVGEMLNSHDCHSAFNLGLLKNKNIDGTTVVQSSSEDESGSEQDEDGSQQEDVDVDDEEEEEDDDEEEGSENY